MEIALRDLLTGRYDLALVGGAQVTTPIPILTLFSQLKRSRIRNRYGPLMKAPTARSRGIGMLVLKRDRMPCATAIEYKRSSKVSDLPATAGP